MGRQLLAEIASADRSDLLMAFIRNTGVAPLKNALRSHCNRGRKLRVLTTTYTGSTEQGTLELLKGAETGSDVMLFCRLRQSERAFWFLGPAIYVEHAGERPIAIVWRLTYRLPGVLYASFAAAVA